MEEAQTASVVRGLLLLGRRMRAARPRDSVTLAGLAILGALRRLGPVPAVRLAEEERLQPQSLTRLIAGLERDGLIAREPDPADGRALLLGLTPRGAAVLAADLRARRRWLEKAMAATLTAAERTVLLDAAAVMLKLAAYDDGAD